MHGVARRENEFFSREPTRTQKQKNYLTQRRKDRKGAENRKFIINLCELCVPANLWFDASALKKIKKTPFKLWVNYYCLV